MEKLPLIDQLRIKLKKTDVPLTVRDIKYGAENMIPSGEYNKTLDLLEKERRDRIMNNRTEGRKGSNMRSEARKASNATTLTKKDS